MIHEKTHDTSTAHADLSHALECAADTDTLNGLWVQKYYDDRELWEASFTEKIGVQVLPDTVEKYILELLNSSDDYRLHAALTKALAHIIEEDWQEKDTIVVTIEHSYIDEYDMYGVKREDFL